MRTWPLWIFGTLVATLIFHLATVLLMPHVIMGVAMSRIAVEGSVNMAHHFPQAGAQSRTIVRPSPDLIYSACVFDLTQGPLRIKAPVPDTYWSLSLYAANTDNFFVLNDRQADSDHVELLLTLEGDAEPSTDVVTPVPTIHSPSATGIVLFRTLIDREDNFAALDTMRRRSRCTPF